MKRSIALVWILLLVTAFAVAQDATIVFVDGFVDIQTEAGAVFPADFGDELSAGDRVITDRDGEAELELGTGGDVVVAPDTVFIVGATTTPSGQRTGRLSAAIGSFSFRFNAAIGNEPRVGSTTSVAGVRGTEVRVYTGSDGTTRFEVIEGLVEITDGDTVVSLAADEAVEVAPGSGAGNVFAFLEQPINYAAWNAALVEDFLADPIDSLDGVSIEMAELLAEIERRAPGIEERLAQSDALGEELVKIGEENGTEARQEFLRETVAPFRNELRDDFVDFRFVVLSALSLRQFVVARMAGEMDAAYFLNPGDPVYRSFLDDLELLDDRFEEVVVPWLVPSDL